MNPSLSSPAGAPLRRIDDLPGPRGLPVLGNALQTRLSHIHRDVEAWALRYGPFFRLKLGPVKMLVTSDHEAINSILRDRPDGFLRTHKVRQITHELGFATGLFSSEGTAWRNQRRMVMASFSPGHVRAYFPSLRKVAQRLQGRWDAAAQSGAPIDLQADLMRFTVDAIAGLAFGADVNTLESDDDIIQRHLDKIFPAVFKRMFALFPHWRYVRLPSDRALERSVAEIQRAIGDFVAQARERLRADPSRREHPPNLLEGLIAAADQPGSGVDDGDVAGNVLTMLLAGEDTTANSLAWLIWLLQRHPQALQRARQEVLRVVPDLAACAPAQLDQLDYLEACIHESMRLKPVAPMMVVIAARDTTVAGIHVPAGTFVWCVMRHDGVHGPGFPDGQRFEPQRWRDGPDGPAEATAHKRAVMPFGAGPRVCPGRYLALLEIKLAMAMLLNRFEIDDVSTPDGSEPAELMSFTMSPAGLRMRLRPRA